MSHHYVCVFLGKFGKEVLSFNEPCKGVKTIYSRSGQRTVTEAAHRERSGEILRKDLC